MQLITLLNNNNVNKSRFFGGSLVITVTLTKDEKPCSTQTFSQFE